MSLITKHITKSDIDLRDKLDNMLGSEISEEIYNKCMSPKTFQKIEDKVWAMMRNSASPFSKTATYEGLADEYDAADDRDKWSACLYNCDLLHMTAIASILKLPIPRSSGDIHIFGL